MNPRTQRGEGTDHAADETGVTLFGDVAERGRKRLVVFAVLRTAATVALVLVLYFLLPLGGGTNVEKIAKLALGALALTAIIIWQVRQIIRSNHPVGRAVEALAFSVPLYMVIFATAYFVMAHSNPAAFGAPLSRTDAMYFSSTVFTTVGFGDITAKSEAARLVVTVQMWLDLVFLGLVLRVVTQAIKSSQQRRAS